MHTQLDAPPWLNDAVVTDAAWADAWEATEESWRARLKTCLAALCEVHAPAPPPGLRISAVERGGMRLTLEERPRPLAACFFTPQASPVQVLAACAPARLLGVERVLAVCLGGFVPAVLCGLELAGVEEAYEISPKDRGEALDMAEDLAGRVARAGGLVLGLGPASELPPGLHWRADLPAEVHVWQEPEGDGPGGLDSGEPNSGDPDFGAHDPGALHPEDLDFDDSDPDAFDLDAVSQAVGSARIVVWNGPGGQPDEISAPFAPMKGNFKDLLASNPEVVYSPEGRDPSAARLRLGPGMEGVWLWPGLASELFLERRAGLHPLGTGPRPL